jgi:hypothetical protein
LPRTPKRITSLSKNRIHKFITKIEQTAQIDNLLQILNELDSNQNWTGNEHKLLENIDVKFTTILLEAEAAIAIPVQYPWSPELPQSLLIYTYWIIHLKGNKTKLLVTKQLNNIPKQLTTHDVYQNNILRRPLMQLRSARKNLINCRLEAHQHRDNYLQIQHETLGESRKMTKAKALQKKLYRKQQRRCWQLLRNIIHGSKTAGGISHVLSPIPNDPNDTNVC